MANTGTAVASTGMAVASMGAAAVGINAIVAACIGAAEASVSGAIWDGDAAVAAAATAGWLDCASRSTLNMTW